MPVGGSRPGSGRPPGAASKKTREIADRAAQEGVTPLEVMINIMREQWELYQAEKTPERAKAAMDAANMAAPYMHPRLAAVEQFVDAKVRSFAVSSEPLNNDEWERTYGPLAAAVGTAKSAH